MPAHLTVFTLSLLASGAYAFDNFDNRHHRSTASRIAGVVIGILFFLSLCILLSVMQRRRRRAMATGSIIGGGYAPGGTGKFGGFGRPWGQPQQNANQWQPNQYPNQQYPQQQQGYFPPVPPPYMQDGVQQSGTFQPPPGPPPVAQQHGSYAAPPGPPPQAHLNVRSLVVNDPQLTLAQGQ
ncbi:hypothetical protein B0H15DRAFT_798882 [Mycena belliarum]|uniref:Uncharacterized protein n=1 Tax=Mycena belliarum TaxID=1033014 RepID=A0AAD6XV03_9AGAR|nr:hypothetical protein B0H15DRAFT_798882 [Mycena belliae]